MKHLFRYSTLALVALMVSSQARATDPAVIAAKQAAQAEGLTVGSDFVSSGALSPSTLISQGEADAPVTLGSDYSATADSTLTGKQNDSSIAPMGNEAKTNAVSGFSVYDNDRADQSNQSVYFLSTGVSMFPHITPTDSLHTWAEPITAVGMASSSSTTCHPTVTTTPIDNSLPHQCIESYEPYETSCVEKLGVAVNHELTCNLGQSYSVSMSSTSGMGHDGCQGGDAVTARWVCTTGDYPSISMGTNNAYTFVNVPNGGSSLVHIQGGCYGQMFNTTSCYDGECSGTYEMRIGVYTSDGCLSPYSKITTVGDIHYGQCCYTSGGDDPTTTCKAPITPGFVEQSWGAGTRIVASGNFSMAKTYAVTTPDTASCAVLRALAE